MSILSISKYEFGKMVVAGVTYQKDLILCRNHVVDNWWRIQGHLLQTGDLAEQLKRFKPKVVVVGTGKYGMMKISSEMIEYIERYNIGFHQFKTGEAAEYYNTVLKKSETLLGAFHLTC